MLHGSAAFTLAVSAAGANSVAIGKQNFDILVEDCLSSTALGDFSLCPNGPRADAAGAARSGVGFRGVRLVIRYPLNPKKLSLEVSRSDWSESLL